MNHRHEEPHKWALNRGRLFKPPQIPEMTKTNQPLANPQIKRKKEMPIIPDTHAEVIPDLLGATSATNGTILNLHKEKETNVNQIGSNY